MYKQFYNLKQNAFEITPDPEFLFASEKHKEALTALYYGVLGRKGFVVMTGEVGTGKTLLVRTLLQLIKSQNMACSYVFNSNVDPTDFLRLIAFDFGLPCKATSKGELLVELNSYLLACHQKKITAVLVIDEAHHLSAEVLEEIRLLMNLETAQEKLLQILLAGQPELDAKLDSFGLRQLKQRIAIRCHLEALTQAEAIEYIQSRLQTAGCDRSDAANLFPSDTVARIHRYTGGIPRLINLVCENALLVACSCQLRQVTPDILEEIACNFRLTEIGPVPQEPSQKSELWQSVKHLLEFNSSSDTRNQEAILPDQGLDSDPYTTVAAARSYAEGTRRR
jgi:general secretion pathway protein A